MNRENFGGGLIMLFQDTILTDQERRNLIDMITGSISRICVTDDCKEIAVMIASVNLNLSKLAQSSILRIRVEEQDA